MTVIEHLRTLFPLESDASIVSAPYAHDRALVGASMLIAVAIAYAYQELAARARTHQGAARLFWNLGAGAMVGGGVWLTHLMGMLALETPLVHGLEPTATAISGIVGILCACLAFAIADARVTLWRLILAGLISAAGGVLMHYLGMRGLRIEADLSYRAALVAITSLGGFLVSVAAVWIAYRVNTSWLRGVLAFPMGAVVAGLHYTDIAAMIVTPRPMFQQAVQAGSEPWQALGIGLATACAVVVALSAVAIDRLTAQRNALEAERNVVEIPSPTRDAEVVVTINPPTP